ARFGPGLVLTSQQLTIDGRTLRGDFTWDVRQPAPGDYLPVLAVRDADGRVVAATTGYPLGGIAAPYLWKAGDRIRDLPRLALPAALPPGAYTVTLSWEERTTHQPLPSVGADGAPLPPTGLVLGRFAAP
ncbi:MAG TPA: hypothetical protein VFW96_11070, partial [Thermomicrobiales bacterium]|nr:hypothetical protein [Thermomicrobiales bacterium]